MDIYTFKNPRPQYFSLPYPIMKYILKNATPKAWKKLIQTCKYFFSKNPVFPVGHLQAAGVYNWYNGRGFIDTNEPIAKLWVYESLFGLSRCTISSLLPKLSKCSVKLLLIIGQNLTLEEYQFITVSGLVSLIEFTDSTVKYSDGKTVTFDKLLENLKNVKNLTVKSVDPTIFEQDTVKKMVKILPNLKKLKYFELSKLSETFDISSFTDFLLKNQTVKVCLEFRGPISDAFKQEIDKCCQKIIKNPPKSKVRIWYPGMDEIQFDQLCKLYNGE